MTDSLQERKSPIKSIVVVILTFLLIPVITATILYFSHENFRFAANNYLTWLPGRAGLYFSNFPTKEEQENIKRGIAKHYITFEEDRLVDKLLIIKAEDEKLYKELLILLSRENPMKMRNVKERLRDSLLKPSLLVRIAEDIDHDKTVKVEELVDYYASLNVSDAISEIHRTYDSGELTDEDLPLIFEKLPIKLASDILRNLDPGLIDKAKYNMPETKRKEIEKEIQNKANRERDLKRQAKVYEIAPFKEKIEDLGTTNKFKSEDLALIYRHMSIVSSAQVLARVDDQEFIADLYNDIDHLGALNMDIEEMSTKLEEGVQIYKNYDKRVKELVEIYEKIPLQELTDIIEEMAKGNKKYRSYLVGQEEIVFTEEDLVLDILRQLKPKKSAELLEQLRTHRSVDLSEKYVLKR